MNATENRLNFEMEDARRNIEFCEEQIAFFEKQAAKYQSEEPSKIPDYYQKQTDKWKQHKQEAHEIYYRAKRELKTLKAGTHAD